ncbi:MAG: class I SAM-dependent methyltransferase [Alcaligenaceae bacterium]|nr:class I SAM-dependent methyltransferase [Alcaligenaceae bacterium]
MTKMQFSMRDRTADTLLLTLYARANESQTARPLIQDDYAIKLVEQIDYDFSIFDNTPTTSVGVALRSVHFDNMTRDFIESHQQPIVVVVGCGLDTRKQRLGAITDKAIFYQLDLPDVIAFRKKILPAEANEFHISGSLLQTKWKDILLSKHPDGDFLFIIEGVLMYFSEPDNRQFFEQIADRFKGAELQFDMFNRWMSQNTALHEGVNRTMATFKFGINNEKQIENWHDDLCYEQTWLLNDFPDWYRMGLPFVSMYLVSYAVRTAAKFLKFTIKQPTA